MTSGQGWACAPEVRQYPSERITVAAALVRRFGWSWERALETYDAAQDD